MKGTEQSLRKNETLNSRAQRVWEFDAWRGFLILGVLANHLNLTVHAFCVNGYYHIDSNVWAAVSDPLGVWYTRDAAGVLRSAEWVLWLRRTCNLPAVDSFFLISGVACMFSKNNLRRALITLGAAAFIAAFTYGLSLWTGDPTRFIRFGALACYAVCQFAYVYVFERLESKWLLLSVIPIFAIGYYLRYVGVQPTRLPIFYIFGVPQIGDRSSDFWPVFPMLGWFLLGVVLGRKFYSEKQTRLPFPKAEKLTRPLQWLGRHSGIIYVSHIVIYTAVFCGIGYLFGLL